MSKVLTARSTDGLVAIHEPGADLDNPLSNLENIYFHSNLDYLTAIKMETVTVNIPAIGFNGKGMLNLFSHPLGRPAILMARRTDTGEAVTGTTVVWSGNYIRNWNAITLGSDAHNVYAYYFGFQSPAVSLQVEIVVLSNPY